MRIILILSIITALRVSTYAQIQEQKDNSVTIGEIKQNGISQVRLLYEIQNEDTVYGIVFLDQQYQTLYEYKDFAFLNIDSALDKLYKAILSVFDPGRNDDYALAFKVGATDINIRRSKTFGVKAIIFANDGYFYLTRKQLDKLFGK